MNQINMDDLKNFLDELSSNNLFSGIVLITQNSETIFEYETGFAIKEEKILNKIDTKFNIGSMDKMFTAVCIAKLVEDKKISFEDLVSKYIPNLPESYKDTMTIHHILTHQEGFSSYFNRRYIEKRLKLKTVDNYLDLFLNEPLLFTPGEKYSYSNSGYVLLGKVIEIVTGKSYYDFVREVIFQKADMRETGSLERVNDDKKIAQGYTNRKVHSQEIIEGERRNNKDDLPFKGSPAGGGYSTAKDLTRFAQALTNSELLSFEMTKRVISPKVEIETKNNTTLCYGYGFQILKFSDGNQRIGHAGGFAGVNTRLDIYPWLDTIVVVLSNYDIPAAFRVANKIAEILA